MWKADKDLKDLKDRRLNREGYVSGICFLIMCSVGFLMIWNTVNFLEGIYQEKLMKFHALKNLSAYDTRADIYSVLEGSTSTLISFDEEVFVNGNRIYIDENNEINIERGE